MCYLYKRMEVTIEFRLPARIRKKGRWFISSCLPLDVHSQGVTRFQAEQNLVDALTSFLVSCYERGTLNIVFRNAGLVPTDSEKGDVRDSVVVRMPFVISRRGSQSWSDYFARAARLTDDFPDDIEDAPLIGDRS